MGIFDFLRRGKKKEAAISAKYILKRRTSKGGMIKVAEYGEPVSIEDLYGDLLPGRYALHKYETGKSGFSEEWAAEVTGEEGEGEEETPKKSKGSSLEQMVNVLKGIAQLQKEAKEEFDIIAPFFGYGSSKDDSSKGDIIDQLTDAKGKYDKLSTFFGERVAGDEPIKYEGNVPIWLHPKLIPVLIDDTMEKIEKRLRKWEVIGKEESTTGKEEEERLPDFPAKPKSENKTSDAKASVEEVPDKEDTEKEEGTDEEGEPKEA